MNDARVPPWHAAKMAARLQASSSSGAPVLLRADFEAGHGLGSSTRAQEDALAADELAFLFWQLSSAGAHQK
jgi:prolyl oligopeptidase